MTINEFGARGRGRSGTPLRESDFESAFFYSYSFRYPFGLLSRLCLLRRFSFRRVIIVVARLLSRISLNVGSRSHLRPFVEFIPFLDRVSSKSRQRRVCQFHHSGTKFSKINLSQLLTLSHISPLPSTNFFATA